MKPIYNLIDKKISFKDKNILDVGTSFESLRYLSGKKFNKLHAISMNENVISSLKAENILSNVELRRVNLSEKTIFEDNYFDIIFADNLFSKLESYVPYKSLYVLNELKRILEYGGMLIVSGWSFKCRDNKSDILVKRIIKLRDVARILNERPQYSEIDKDCMCDMISSAGFNIIQTNEIENTFDLNFFNRYFENIKLLCKTIKNNTLKNGISEEADEIFEKAQADASIKTGHVVGGSYMLLCQKNC